MLEPVDDETLASRNALAAAVRDELAAVGIPVIPNDGVMNVRFAAGACVYVDRFQDSGGGVHLS